MYEVDGTPMLLQPLTPQWMPRTNIGIDGSMHRVYEPTYSFKLSWGPMTFTQFNQLCAWWSEISVTGTHCINLPERCGAAWATGTYCGVVFDEPESEHVWEEHLLRPSMLIRNITA